MFWFQNIPYPCKFIDIRATIAKSLILLGPSLWNLAIQKNLHISLFKTIWILSPMTKNDILWTKFKNSFSGQSAKVEIFRNHQKNQQIFIVRLTKSLVCAVIAHRWYEFTLSARALSCSQFCQFQLIFNTYSKNTIIFHQIDFVANFPLYILIDGSSQTFLVISQFFMFFAEMLHISAERHLSKISFSYFYSPWHPQTFGTIKKIGVSPSFTLAVKSTVNFSQS